LVSLGGTATAKLESRKSIARRIKMFTVVAVLLRMW